ncbi:MAG: bifunctional aspartate kinase/homoserine dehydrogenase [Bacteroidota bacterium]
MHIVHIKGELLGDAKGMMALLRQSAKLLQESSCLLLITGRLTTENKLTSIAQSAAEADTDFSALLTELETGYLQLAREIVPVVHQGTTLSFIRKQFNDIDDLCKGIQLLGECPAKTLQLINSIPALIMVQLCHAACRALEIPSTAELNPGESASTLIILADNRNSFHPAFQLLAGKVSQITCMVEDLPFVTADPASVKHAKDISFLTHDEAIELSRHTANSISADLIAWAKKHQLDITIKARNENETSITGSSSMPDRGMVTGITAVSGYALISIEGSGMIGVAGFAQRVFAALFRKQINISLISQGASEHAICIAVEKDQCVNAAETLTAAFETEISEGVINPIQHQLPVALLELIGENMRNHPGISGRMFGALGNNGINILAIAQGSNERNISAVVRESDRNKALNVLHEAFFEHTFREVNLFITGTGNVGKKLLEQLTSQIRMLAERQHIRVVLAGISNSRKMCIDPAGIDPMHWEAILNSGENANAHLFANEMTRLNLRNSVLVDVTANKEIPDLYAGLLKKSMSVVACNKIAASDRYEKYRELKQLALAYNCRFLFETNVGAALPVIGTLNDLIKSGDQILRVEAVLSGTLNFVFNNYDGKKSFASVVKAAQDEGYTEPDPRLDLSGTDVMRKIMILAREAGLVMEMEEISCHAFLPSACMEGSVDDFYVSLEKHEPHFRSLLQGAEKENAKLKFVATLAEGKASVGLQHIQPSSEMYHLYGKDNIVLFYTERYPLQPLVVKGAGAGAAVTASGVFADILRTINR